MTEPSRVAHLIAALYKAKDFPAENRSELCLSPQDVRDLIEALGRLEVLESQRAELLEKSQRAIRLAGENKVRKAARRREIHDPRRLSAYGLRLLRCETTAVKLADEAGVHRSTIERSAFVVLEATPGFTLAGYLSELNRRGSGPVKAMRLTYARLRASAPPAAPQAPQGPQGPTP